MAGYSYLSVMSSRVVDKIDPFLNKASIRGRKQKRSQGSSHYRTKGPTELTALPHLKGEKICSVCRIDTIGIKLDCREYFVQILPCDTSHACWGGNSVNSACRQIKLKG